MDIYKQLGKTIRALRRVNNIPEEIFAEKINVSLKRLKRIEEGESLISIMLLDKIAEVLDIDTYMIVKLAKQLYKTNI